MTIFDSNTRVFYNPDCDKYGVQQLVKGIRLHCKDGVFRQLYKWSQVAIGDKTYTPYKKVAERWADSVRDTGVLEVRADMEDEYRA
jgi:hypothetical protein